MNTQQIKSLIADEKTKIGEEELFSSPSYRNYLQNIADNVSGKYGRGAFVQTEYTPDIDDTASTDNFTIKINGVSQKKWAFRYSKIEKCGIMII